MQRILPPLTLYIHYPWCVKKCPYCDFNSHENGDKSGYIDDILQDLDVEMPYVQGRTIDAIFIGGGTPSLMSVSELDELFGGLQSKLKFSDTIEVTLEAIRARSKLINLVHLSRLVLTVYPLVFNHLIINT